MSRSVEESFFPFDLDESYFLIPAPGTESGGSQSQSQSASHYNSNLLTIKQLTHRAKYFSDFVFHYQEKMHVASQQVCSSCFADLLLFLDKSFRELSEELHAFDMSMANFQDRLEQEEENMTHYRMLEEDLRDLQARMEEGKRTEKDHRDQLESITHSLHSVTTAIDQELANINQLELEAESLRMAVAQRLQLAQSCLCEMKVLSTPSIAPLFDILHIQQQQQHQQHHHIISNSNNNSSSQHTVSIINGFRFAYMASPAENLSWAEVNFSWALLCKVLLSWRHRHHLSDTLTFHSTATTTTTAAMSQQQRFNDLAFTFTPKARSFVSAGNDDAVVVVTRELRLQPLRQRAIVYLTDTVKRSPIATTAASAMGNSGTSKGSRSSLGSDSYVLSRPSEEDLMEAADAFSSSTFLFNNNSSNARSPKLPRAHREQHGFCLQGGNSNSNRGGRSSSGGDVSYQAAVSLVALYLAATVVELNCTNIAPTSSLLHSLCQDLTRATGRNNNSNNNNNSGSRLFKFLDACEAIHVESDDGDDCCDEDNNNNNNSTDLASSSMSGGGAAVVTRGRSEEEMKRLTQDIFLTVEQLVHTTTSSDL